MRKVDNKKSLNRYVLNYISKQKRRASKIELDDKIDPIARAKQLLVEDELLSRMRSFAHRNR